MNISHSFSGSCVFCFLFHHLLKLPVLTGIFIGITENMLCRRVKGRLEFPNDLQFLRHFRTVRTAHAAGAFHSIFGIAPGMPYPIEFLIDFLVAVRIPEYRSIGIAAL